MFTETLDTLPDREIVTTRVIHFPIATVFSAWSEPQYLKEWWGPAGFTNTFRHFDFREGGIWTFTMHGPEKGNYENACEFIKIEKPFLIAWKRHSKPLFQVLVTFEEVSPNETKLVFKQIFETVEECEKIRKHTVGKNDENFDKLEKLLGKMVNP